MEMERGGPVHILDAWKEGHKGKDGNEFCSKSAKEKYETFTAVFQEAHGEDAEPTSQPLDPELVVIAGEGKRGGRHLICNGAIATSTHRKLHEIRASSTSSTPSIRSRPTSTSREVTRLKKRAAKEEEQWQAEQEARAREQAETNERIKTLEQKLEAFMQKQGGGNVAPPPPPPPSEA